MEKPKEGDDMKTSENNLFMCMEDYFDGKQSWSRGSVYAEKEIPFNPYYARYFRALSGDELEKYKDVPSCEPARYLIPVQVEPEPDTIEKKFRILI